MSAMRARQKLTRWLYDTMVGQQFDDRAGRRARKRSWLPSWKRRRPCPGVVALEDVTRQKLTYRRLLAGAAAMAEQWRSLLAG